MDGTFAAPGLRVHLSRAEAALLRSTAEEVAALLAGGVPERGADPVRDRLFPRAYLDPTEERAEADWQTAVHPELAAGKAEALEMLVGHLDAARRRRAGQVEVRLAPDDVERWVAALNDLRLVLGTRLGVSDDDPNPDPDADPAQAPERAAYRFLTALQGELVAWLAGDLDPLDPDDLER